MNGLIDMSALTDQTLAQLKDAIDIRKSISVGTGLVGYDLRGPAIDLKPVLTPIVNLLPRTPAAVGSGASSWKMVTNIAPDTSSPFLAEGAAGGGINYTVVDKSAPYKTWGRKDEVTDESEMAALGFEDVRARSNFWLLNMVKLEEEDSFLGANTSMALGVTPAPTLAAGGTGATLPALTYSVRVVALTYFGYQRATKSAPLALLVGVAGTNAGKSSAATQAITLGQTLSMSVAVVNGAFAYAWYVGAAGAETLQAITTINSLAISAPLTGSGQAATAIAGTDNSSDPLATDGILTQLLIPGSGATISVLPNGVAGTGSVLTSDGAGGIVEIDAILKNMWDIARVGPDRMFVNAQQAADIYKRILNSSGAYRILLDGAAAQQNVTAGGAVVTYVNKFTSGTVRIEIHPTMAPGTIFFHTQQLPAWFPGNRAPGAIDVHVLRDYYEIPFPSTERKWVHGVYVRGTVRCFLPTAQAILTNIAAG